MENVQLLTHLANSELAASLRQTGFDLWMAASVAQLDPTADCVIVDDASLEDDADLAAARKKLGELGSRYVVATRSRSLARAREWIDAGASDVFLQPILPREAIVRIRAVLKRKVRIVCLGGGTGLYHLLRGLKSLPDAYITSVVTMADDGGSSGRLRAEFGILPPGDVRRSLVALSDAPQLMSEVIQYRFGAGEGLTGHSLGNLILTALSDLTGSLPDAVRALGDILHISGVVLCASRDAATLCAQMEDGSIIRGESAIDQCEGRPPNLRIAKLWQEPQPSCDLDTFASILTADVITIGPGDLYTSVLANLTVSGISDAIRDSKARVVYIVNVMTKPGETTGYKTADHVREVVRYLGADRLDAVIVSNTPLTEEHLSAYARLNQAPVSGALEGSTRARLIEADVAHPAELVRHDGAKLAAVIRELSRGE
jgi:uncharacterized cofD-like protein